MGCAQRTGMHPIRIVGGTIAADVELLSVRDLRLPKYRHGIRS